MINEVDTDNFNDFNPTNELSKKIEPINRDTVHKICSGQVILNLAVAVKELVENSLDAGATIIEIKLRDQGLELIEVTDNGSGVEEENFKGLTAKYHTSKIREFSDLECVETFGFRGEALSSLCGISDMLITTRHKSAEFGTKLEMDYYGVVKKKSPCPREVGTTVTLKNLFSTLPVRKREFAKNVKKEFNRMCQILQGYCLVSKGVRIICTNQNKKGNKTVLLQTNGSSTILENISAIFGQKQSNELIEIKSPNDVLSNTSLLDLDNSHLNADDIDIFNLSNFQINGWISNINNECGRSIRDRQFFFINSRPFEPKQIIKLFNETYNKYNANQQPFIFINILIDRKNTDVNLTPDKRQILINNEKMLLLALKQSLLNTFNELTNNYKVDNINTINRNKNVKELTENSICDEQVRVKPNTQKFSEMLSQWKATGKTDEPCKHLDKSHKRKQSDEIIARTIKMKKIQEYLSQDVGPNEKNTNKHNIVDFSYMSDNSENEEEKNISVLSTQDQEDLFCVLDDLNKINELTPPDSEPQVSDNAEEQLIDEINQINCKIEIISDESEKKLKTETVQSAIKINATIEDIKSLIQIEDNFIKTKKDEENKMKLSKLKFKSEIKPNSNKNAEQELNKEIKKNDFLQMKIIGQFNFGFIIVQLNNDLFIIDQHASDEKYNFEMLQKVTKLDTQVLVIPQPLELTAVNELLLIDNINIFNMNGFTFIIDENAEPTKKIKLTGKPFSKNWEFGKEDIDELLFMLHDSPNTMCRPSRVRSMFASRACRKSVMIGKPLTKIAMKRLVDHMAELDHPWNCPHGRPTMRHLLNLAMLNNKKNE